MIVSNSKFVRVVQEGQFYYPANKHYGGENQVICDRCQMKNIKCCLGIEGEDVDLCMNCVGEVINEIEASNYY